MGQIELNDIEKATYEWQMSVPGFGEEGQKKLRNACVMISRCGGLGSVVAYELAAAGIGKLVLAHGGNVKHSDLNRQLLMTYDWLGKPRIQSVARRLKDLNPRLDIVAVDENVHEDNVVALTQQADVIVDCAPLFQERYLMNQQAVLQKKPMVECAMYELEAQVTSIMPGKTACLSCLYPEFPSTWKREFPVFGAVSGTLGCIAAMEAIKIVSGLGTPLYNQLLAFNLGHVSFMKTAIQSRPDCQICGTSTQ
jgi:molybdopterin/thiamine biosynthesis adenylyltransferase